MGILSSMMTGITGMQGQGEAISIYGDNIANANTYGFKTSRAEFQDVVAKSLKGMMGGNQIGKGTRLSAVTPIFSQGSILQSESNTDLALVGDGFFTLKGPDGQTFTRSGTFRFDKDGKLVNSDGLKVQGFTADDKGKITSKMGDISVDRTVVDANKTSQVNMFMNLDLRADKAKVFDPEMPENSSHFSTGVTVYDSAGTAHVVTMFFNKVEDGTWQWNAMAKGEEVQDGIPGKMMLQASGKLLFDSDGKLKTQAIDQNSFNFSGGAIPDQAINFDFGVSKEQGGPGNQVTQYGTESQAYKQTQDGYSAGTLSGLTFNDDGTLAAVYSNGQNLTLAQLGLAKFENNEGLFKLGQNRYRESRLSGSPTIGAPMTGGRASIVSKALESSTTDIAQEFINLMTAQRGFQANTKVITASDEMMQDVLNIKRG